MRRLNLSLPSSPVSSTTNVRDELFDVTIHLDEFTFTFRGRLTFVDLAGITPTKTQWVGPPYVPVV